jgi:hypothetical protein
VPSPGQGMCRGRFWALVSIEEGGGLSGDSEEEGDCVGGSSALESDSGRPTPSVSLVGFISRMVGLGGALHHGRRDAFAPEGKGTRFRSTAPSRFRRLGDSTRVGSRGRENSAPREGASVPSSPPVPGQETTWEVSAPWLAPPANQTQEDRVSSGWRERGTRSCSPKRSGPLGLDGLDGPLVCSFQTGLEGGQEAQQEDPPSMQQGATGSNPAADRPSGLVEQTKLRFRWLWMPVGCTRPELGFLARSSEVRKRLLGPLAPPHRLLRRAPDPRLPLHSFAAVVMDRSGEGGLKRNFARYASGRR